MVTTDSTPARHGQCDDLMHSPIDAKYNSPGLHVIIMQNVDFDPGRRLIQADHAETACAVHVRPK